MNSLEQILHKFFSVRCSNYFEKRDLSEKKESPLK